MKKKKGDAMKIEQFEKLVDRGLDKILSSFPDEYIQFLSVVSKHYNHTAKTQLSIYQSNRFTVQLHSYQKWKTNKARQVKVGSTGIPALVHDDAGLKVEYLFDIQDTIPLTNRKTYSIWYFNKLKGEQVLNNIIQNGLAIDSKMIGSLDEKMSILIKSFLTKEAIQDLAQQLYQTNEEQVKQLYLFVFQSLQVTLSLKTQLPEEVDISHILNQKNGILQNRQHLLCVIDFISRVNREIVSNIILESFSMNIQYDFEKKLEEKEYKQDDQLYRIDTTTGLFTNTRSFIELPVNSRDVASDVSRKHEGNLSGRSELSAQLHHDREDVLSDSTSKSESDPIQQDDGTLSEELVDAAFKEDQLTSTEENTANVRDFDTTAARESQTIYQNTPTQAAHESIVASSNNGSRGELHQADQSELVLTESTNLQIEDLSFQTQDLVEYKSLVFKIEEIKKMDGYFTARIVEQQENPELENKKIILFKTDEELKEKFSLVLKDAQAKWIVEFNEVSEESLCPISYAGQEVTKELLQHLQKLDQDIKIRFDQGDKSLGCFKFYFEKQKQGQVEESMRVDIGDGAAINNQCFAYLYEQIGEQAIELPTKPEQLSFGLLESLQEDSSKNLDEHKDLMPKDLLRKVAGLYQQEKLDGADKLVYAEYFIPFQSNWTWYLTEYDSKRDLAFGLVCGHEVEWGYFSLKELEELGAMRFAMEYPKPFKDIVQTSLVKQMSKEELERVFNGKLAYSTKVAVSVGTEFTVVDQQVLKEKGIQTSASQFNVVVDETTYPVYQGISFEESQKVDRLLESGQYPIYKLNEHQEKEWEKQPDSQLARLSTSEYLPGLTVTLKGKEYEILENQFVEDGMSALTIQSISSENELTTQKTILYTKDRPVDQLFAQQQELVNQQQKNFEQEKEKQLDVVDEDVRVLLGVGNYRISADSQVDQLAPSERLNRNIEAISMLKRIQNKQRDLDQTAQDILSKYVGWGGLAEVFDDSKQGQWAVARKFLQENLSDLEYSAAKESTLTSFYTPKIVIDGMYQVLKQLGFEKGNILEPSVGVGNFIGNLPEAFSSSTVFATEIDSISGSIAKYLYPNSKIAIQGFEKADYRNNFFDVAIGNVPFGEFKVADHNYAKFNFLIHDYFFAKAIDKVRPGGVIAFITSSGTLDKKDDNIRKYIGSRCNLLGAIRLPRTTFKGVAGTEVTSDILFLQKTDEISHGNKSWYELASDEQGYVYNRYFVEHPEMVVGQMQEVSGRFGYTLACLLQEDQDFGNLFQQAIHQIQGSIQLQQLDDVDEKQMVADPSIKNYTFTACNQSIYYRENSVLIKQVLTDKESKTIQQYIQVKQALKLVIDAQVKGEADEVIQQGQSILNLEYDKFQTRFGFINSKTNRKLLVVDADFPLLSSLELYDQGNYIGKASIFSKRTIKQATVIEKADSIEEALTLSIAATGRVDLDYIKKLSNTSEEEILTKLKGKIYLDYSAVPAEQEMLLPYTDSTDRYWYNFVPAEEFLSGNLQVKLDCLHAYKDRYEIELSNAEIRQQDFVEKEGKNYTIAQIQQELTQVNHYLEDLTRHLPARIKASDISVRIGATWIAPHYIDQFIIEVLKISRYHHVHARYAAVTDKWTVENKKAGDYMVQTKYSTNRVNCLHILEDMLNLREIKVYDQKEVDGKKVSVLNKDETFLANQKAEVIQAEFKNWIFSDVNRRKRLEDEYNTRFNTVRPRKYDGSFLTLDGINTSITLKKHQLDAIARAILSGNTLLGHVVGAGKTFTMAAIVMESKRLGLSTKAMMVVPNHLTIQTAKEFLTLYPSANVLVASKKDFETKNRKRFTSKIATGEFDVVIIGHSQFEKIRMSKEYQQKHLQQQIAEAIEAIAQYKYDHDQRFTVKQLEATRKKLEVKLEKLNDDFKKDDVVDFENLGIDKLLIDEAHLFKNLHLQTKMQNVAGIGQAESQKASDMFMKCRYMDELTGSKGVVFATGTPISNTMSELYTMQRYLQYDQLKELNLHHFDSWASTFAETIASFELAPEGDKYRIKTRFAKFYNLPELMNMFSMVADIQTADMLDLPTPVAHFKTIVTKPSADQKEILKELSNRAEDVRDRKVDAEEDNMLKITSDGKKLALDQRLINPDLADLADSKVNVCVDNIYNIYKETEQDKLTQLVFCDSSTPKQGTFNIYDDVKQKLIQKGVQESDIDYIHNHETETAKDILFDKVRKGNVRILLGSTAKMGAGTNVQDRLIALHDLDVPWRPSDLQQRAGRIVRRGNQNKEVYIYRYVTENTFDSYLWQIIENKQRFISQVMTSKSPSRVAEDVDEGVLSYAEIKALATNNPLIKEKMELENDITKLRMLESSYKSTLYALQDKINYGYPEELMQLQKIIDKTRFDIKDAKDGYDPEHLKITINQVIYSDKKEAEEKIREKLKETKSQKDYLVGQFRGFNILASFDSNSKVYRCRLNNRGNTYVELEVKQGVQNLTRLNNAVEKLNDKLLHTMIRLEDTQNAFAQAKIDVNLPFVQEEELLRKTLRLNEVNLLLNQTELTKTIEVDTQQDIEL